MLRRILLPVIFGSLAYGFWVSPNFKEIAAGVAIFLFGMLSLEEGFKAFTGGKLEALLQKTTDKLWKSLSFGILTTTVMQSSSLVSVITISFLSAGLIGLAAGIGIIFGANLGTTTGAWLVAGFGMKVKISAYALPMLVFGIILVFQKSRQLKGFGYILAGLGFLFLGVHYMKEGFEAFRDTLDLTAYAMPGYQGVVVFAFIGIAATVIMQSSHATLVLIITALAAQQITYENALALAIGANVGTTITAIIGAASANVDGRRLAGAHLIFNVVTGAIAIAFIYQLGTLVDLVSQYVGIAADDYTLKLAVFHTIFNLIGIIVMLPFINKLVTFLTRVLKPKVRTTAQPRHLHNSVMEMPDTAVEAVRKETIHLYDNAYEVIVHGLNLHRSDLKDTDRPLSEIVEQSKTAIDMDIDELYNSNIKTLYGEIVSFISRAQTNMPPSHLEEIFQLRSAGRDIVEAIKDIKHLRKNLTVYIADNNPNIRDEYNKLRLQLASVLVQLEQVRSGALEPSALVELDSLKLEMEGNDLENSGRLDQLIREDQISPEMATSLMNDASYAYDVARNLVDMGEILFIGGSLSMKKAGRSLSLDRNEIDELLQEAVNEPGAIK